MPRDAIVSLIAPSRLMENHEAKHLPKILSYLEYIRGKIENIQI